MNFGDDIELVDASAVVEEDSSQRSGALLARDAVPSYVLLARRLDHQTAVDSDDEDSEEEEEDYKGKAGQETRFYSVSERDSEREEDVQRARPPLAQYREDSSNMSVVTPLSSDPSCAVEQQEEEDEENKTKTFWEWLEKRYGHVPRLETSIADTENLPLRCKWFTYFTYMFFLALIGGAAFYNNYTLNRTQTFITLDKYSGVCKDNRTLDTCCEVAASITGTYLIDNQGRWNTESSFSYVNQIYAVSLTGLTYTNEQWITFMKLIYERLQNVAVARGSVRDFAWNLVAWASFTAVSYQNGFLQFYSSADVTTIFDKPSYHQGYASAHSDDASCRLITKASVSGTKISIFQDLNISLSGQRGKFACAYEKKYGQTTVNCTNPCPKIFPGPTVLGFDNSRAQSSELTWSVDAQAVMTALAINMRITPLNNLQNFVNDTQRLKLFKSMADAGVMNPIGRQMSSYFELRFAPTTPIYCADFHRNGSVVSCLVRVGNLLVYPIISSFGYPDLIEVDENTNTTAAARRRRTQAVQEEREEEEKDDELVERDENAEEDLLWKLQERERVLRGDMNSVKRNARELKERHLKRESLREQRRKERRAGV